MTPHDHSHRRPPRRVARLALLASTVLIASVPSGTASFASASTVPPATSSTAAGGTVAESAVSVVPQAVCTPPDVLVPIAQKPLFLSDYGRTGKDVLLTADGWRAEQEPTLGRSGPVQTDRISVVPASALPGSGPAKPTTGSLRVQLKPYESRSGAEDGDVTVTGTYAANRAEVYGRYPDKATTTPAESWPDPVGSTRYYTFAVLVPQDYTLATDTKWTNLTQWKGFRGGSPPLALEIKRDEFLLGGSVGSLRVNVPKNELGTVKPGVWTTFTVGMHLSPERSQGWVEVYRDGVLRVPRVSIPTMDVVNGKPDPIYLKQGIYRTKSWQVTHTVYFGPVSVSDRRPGS